ncbi:MAG: putative sulfate exporter family transporter [Selenomonas ruminantium]|jgi:uncharacterized membrane protein YadS|nr:putative sulfate exporter family transporter [Selenomonas ruminantium]
MTAEPHELLVQKPGFFKSEDWWAVWLGLLIVALGAGQAAGVDLLGWVAKYNVWSDIGKAVAPNSKEFAFLGGFGSMLATYLFLLILTTAGAYFMGSSVKRFVAGFTILYWVTVAANTAGNFAYLAATPNNLEKFGIGWSLGLGELGFVIALVLGLIIGNFFPKAAAFLSTAAKPEWYIKTGIVILGMTIAIKTVGAMGLASTVIFRGICAVVEAYLIYWPVVYIIARKFFKFTPEWAAPMASGISICGVAAAIATGSAIRARAIVPTVLSLVIIVFVAVELLILPWIATTFFADDPLVAGAWMGLAVKSDGGAIASGAITDSLIRAKALAEYGVNYQEGWTLMAATTAKVFIDVFIGIWAFVLAVVWSVYQIGTKRSEGKSYKVSFREIGDRFPKFLIGFLVVFGGVFLWGITNPDIVKAAGAGAGQANLLRSIFFGLCFFSIGLITNVRKLWAEGLGRIVGVYALALFGFILWVGLGISYLFYHGILPPVVAS